MAKHALFGLTPDYLKAIPAFLAVLSLGKFLEEKEKERLTRFRDKSYMYGGNVKEGDPPSWPRRTLY